MPHSTNFQYHYSKVNLYFYNSLVEQHFKESKKDEYYFNAVSKYLLDKPLSESDKKNFGKYIEIFMDPRILSDQLRELFPGQTFSYSQHQEACAAKDSSPEAHGVKIFIKLKLLQLIVDYMRQWGFNSRGSGRAAINEVSIEYTFAYLKEQNYSSVYRQLETADNNKVYQFWMKFFVLMMVASQGYPFLSCETSAMQNKQMQLLTAIADFDITALKDSLDVIVPIRARDPNLGESRAVYVVFLLFFVTTAGLSYFNNNREFFAGFFKQPERLVESFQVVEQKIQEFVSSQLQQQSQI